MKSDEKITMFIDYSHLNQFRFELEFFIEKITNEFNRFEGYLRRAVTQFMVDLGH